MRAAIVLAGSLLFVSSAFAAETQVPEGSLEKFGATGLVQETLIVASVSTRQAARKAPSAAKVTQVTKETQVTEGSLEKFGATGLSQ